jgi:hypothetical protein
MKWISYLVAGLGSVIVGAVVLGFCGILAIKFVLPPHGRSSMAYYLVTAARSPVTWAIGVALFVVGIWGEYRKR